MNKHLCWRVLCTTFLTFIVAVPLFAQSDVQSRSVASDGFRNSRPPSARPAAGGRNPAYNPVTNYKRPFPRRASPVRKRAANVRVKQRSHSIGLTLWRLRPPGADERGYFFPVIDDKDNQQMWLAERVALDSIFSKGDKIRFAIESTVEGYLYIVDRESYSDGGFGSPILIFPETPQDDNFVRPGMLVDIPDQREDFPYYNMKAKDSRYTGELLTIIISPKPLKEMLVDAEGKIMNAAALSDLELEESEITLFTREDKSDDVFTRAEASSSCGIKTRQLEREKRVGRPCGSGVVPLTRDDPMPQSIFKLTVPADKPAVVFFRLAVK